jgi:Tfp pilus assembly protein PilE
MTHTDHRGFLFMEGSLMVLIAGVGIFSAALFPAMTAYLERSRQMNGSLETQVSPSSSSPSDMESEYAIRGRDTHRLIGLKDISI